MVSSTTGRTLKTTRTSLRILDLVREHDGLRLAELNELLDKPKSSLHAHLRTLEQCRFLVETDGVYRVALHQYVLGEHARQRHPASGPAEKQVARLAETTGEEANFTVAEHGRLVMIHAALADSSGGTRMLDFRWEFFMHNTAAGKAILSELPDERVDAIVDRWGLPSETEATIDTRDELDAALEQTADRGYGVVVEEFAEGLIAVGAAVRDSAGTVVGGLSVGGPTYRIDRERLHDELAPELLAVVEELEAALAS